MTDCPRDQVCLVLEIVLAFLEAAKGLGDVAGDDGFSVMMRDLDIRKGWNRLQLSRFCKSEQFSGYIHFDNLTLQFRCAECAITS